MCTRGQLYYPFFFCCCRNLTQFAAHKFATTSCEAPTPPLLLQPVTLLKTKAAEFFSRHFVAVVQFYLGSRLCAKVRVIQFFMRQDSRAAYPCVCWGWRVWGLGCRRGRGRGALKTKDSHRANMRQRHILASNFDGMSLLMSDPFFSYPLTVNGYQYLMAGQAFKTFSTFRYST